MRSNRFRKSSFISKKENRRQHPNALPEHERRKRKREILLIFAVIFLVVFLTFLENKIIHFGSDFPISNTILMFILININLLLLILLIFLVFRNLAKLLYDRKRKVMGAKLRTRLVMAFITITLLPTIVLFFFSINFITSSIEFWFNVPVEQSLENSLRVGRRLYSYLEAHNQFFMKRIAYQIEVKKLLDPDRKNELSRYIRVVQREFNLHGVEVYGISVPGKKVSRLASARGIKLESSSFKALSDDNFYKEFGENGVRSVSEEIPGGELTRTIGAFPFGAAIENAEAFLVLSALIPSGLSENLNAISRGVEEYQQIQLLKDPIQVTYYITISIVALLVLFCAIWFGFYLAKSISIPIMQLAEGTRKVAEGDLSFSIAPAADDEIGSLVDSFNKMTRELRTNREQLELSARMLRQQNVEIEARRQYMEIVLKNVSTGVMTLDADGFVVTANTSAETMLNIRSDEILNQSYENLLKGQHLNLAGEVMEHLAHEGSVEFPLRLTIGGSPRSFMIRLNAMKDDVGHHVGIVMAFDDLTELEKAQRMAAWREVARRIAHEVKNPLTPIKLSAQRLSRRYSGQLNEPVFDECTRMIIDHVDLIRNLVNEFSTFAKFPTANPQPCDLPPIIEETVALYREGHPNVRFEICTPDAMPQFNLDRQQIKQAMINLVNNAIAAMKEQGHIIITLIHDALSEKVRIEVVDDGPGISDEVKTRLFEPYFSTKKTGMGLGLTIVSSIVADHHGRMDVRDNLPRGARFIIELPE
ncbi:MAG: PAS domain-containing sensor histidine kinase [Deltaproteobacteria bacterium]|nr:MAG: PAS domain-containing sensor histidine kinase [Deltaproteobacteria bacterium]